MNHIPRYAVIAYDCYYPSSNNIMGLFETKQEANKSIEDAKKKASDPDQEGHWWYKFDYYEVIDLLNYIGDCWEDRF